MKKTNYIFDSSLTPHIDVSPECKVLQMTGILNYWSDVSIKNIVKNAVIEEVENTIGDINQDCNCDCTKWEDINGEQEEDDCTIWEDIIPD